jgi:FkbM family methyltransferase
MNSKSFIEDVDLSDNIISYSCIFDNNVNLKVIKYSGKNEEIIKMYDFYNGGSLLLREPKKRQIISNLINKNIIDKNKNFIDGGAFLGDTTLPLCLNINGIVYSIDPGDINVDIMQNLAELNNIKNIKILKYCLGSTNEMLFYNYGPYGSNFNSFSKIKGEHKYNIESISLDELCNRKIIENIDFIHIDVENLENEVLKGSYNLIQMYNPFIIFEGHIKSNPDKVNECLFFLKKNDYIIYMIDEDAGCPEDARNFISVPQKRNDFFKNNFDFLNYIILVE